MRYTREWDLPIGDCVGETFEAPTGWGQSYFWYCRRCIFVYAKAWIFPADQTLRIWQGLSGLCPNCPGDRWTIPGGLSGPPVQQWDVPLIVARYQLDRELDFLTHAQHPHYQEQTNEPI